jgi:hypothetical protein
MEMPEGWKRVNQSISEYKTTTDAERMLDLLKDMAEVLDELETTTEYFPEIEPVLRRFREWK